MNEQEREKIQNALVFERDRHAKVLNELRKDRNDAIKSANERKLSYVKWIGELSLAFVAVITPVLIVKDEPIDQPSYIFLGILGYLTVGFMVLFGLKHDHERDLVDIPGMGLEQELDMLSIIDTYNKLIFDQTNDEYISELRSKSSALSTTYTQKMGQKEKLRVNLWLDLIIVLFTLATLFILRTIWVFGDQAYWHFIFSPTLVIVLLISLFSYQRARDIGLKNRHASDKIVESYRQSDEWQQKNIFKK